jgi:deoxyribonuclease V
VWPADPDGLVAAQHDLARQEPSGWTPAAGEPRLGGCWVCFPRGLTGRGTAGDPAWCAAVVVAGGRTLAERTTRARASGPYLPGLLALRAGPLLDAVVRPLLAEHVQGDAPDVLLLDAGGRDHPRRAGLAIHLGAEVGIPTVGVTHRPLLAVGPWPADRQGATSPLLLDGDVVGHWVRTRAGTRPLAVHPGWRVDPEQAVSLVLTATAAGRRTPEPLRRARHLARSLRADDTVGR